MRKDYPQTTWSEEKGARVKRMSCILLDSSARHLCHTLIGIWLTRHFLETVTSVEQTLRPGWPQGLGLWLQWRADPCTSAVLCGRVILCILETSGEYTRISRHWTKKWLWGISCSGIAGASERGWTKTSTISALNKWGWDIKMKGISIGGSPMMERMHVTEQPTSRRYRGGHRIFNHYYCTHLKCTFQSLVSILRKGRLVFNICTGG